MNERNLECRFDSRQSFYNKARVIENGDEKILVSYTTNVASISHGKAKVFGTHSPTTLRHIKEFLRQNGFTAINKKQIIHDYM